MGASTSSAYLGSGYFDDVHDADYVPLSTHTAVGETPADLTVDGATGDGPICPDNFNLKVDWLILTNATNSAILATVQLYDPDTSTTIPLFTWNLAARASEKFDEDQFKILITPGYKLQVVSNAATSLNAHALARMTPGAGQ